jgi:hypothetical protein
MYVYFRNVEIYFTINWFCHKVTFYLSLMESIGFTERRGESPLNAPEKCWTKSSIEN